MGAQNIKMKERKRDLSNPDHYLVRFNKYHKLIAEDLFAEDHVVNTATSTKVHTHNPLHPTTTGATAVTRPPAEDFLLSCPLASSLFSTNGSRFDTTIIGGIFACLEDE